MTRGSIGEWLNGPPQHRIGVRVLEVCLGLALLLRAATEVRFAAWLWGPSGIGRGTSAAVLGEWAPAVDWIYGDVVAVHLALAMQAFGAMLLVTGRARRAGAALALFGLAVLEWRTTEINDGGDNFARLALIYMLLLVEPRAKVAAGSLRAYLHNLGVVLLGAQILILYATAGLAKAMGEVWTNGTALYLVSQVEEFSLPGLRAAFAYPLVTVAASYTTVLWQVTFPIGVFSRFKLAYVALGILFHIGIASFMGLITFSTVMLGAELVLVDDDEYEHLRAQARRLADRVRSRWAARGGLR